MRAHVLAGLVLIVTVWSPAIGRAADAPKDEVAERAKKRLVEGTPGVSEPLSLVAEFGTALSRGNTETMHLQLDARLIWVPAERWVSTTVARALYEESYSQVTANAWSALERVDRWLSGHVSVFAAAGFERDIFSGIAQRYSGQLGVGFLLLEVKDPAKADLVVDKIEGELGGYVARENRTIAPNSPPGTVLADDSVNIVAARAAASYKHSFAKGDEVGLSVEDIQDFVDTSNNVFGATAWAGASLTAGLGLKIAAAYRFDNVPAEATLKKSDFLLTASIVVSL